MHLSRCHRVIAGAARPCWSRANLAALPLAIHAAAHAHAQAMPISAHGTRLYKRHFSASSGGSSSSSSSSFLPSQTPIIMPRLAPRMEYGRVAQWLVSEGDEIKPLQVFMLIETDDLTEDGSSYLLEIESHEGGVLRRILRPAGTDTITVDTPLAVFEDPDWQEGEPARGDFLWQAYAKKGAVQTGCCTPSRGCSDEEPTEPTPSSLSAAADPVVDPAAASAATPKPTKRKSKKATETSATPNANADTATKKRTRKPSTHQSK